MQLEIVKPSQKQKILDRLKAAGSRGVLNTDLNKICFRYSARIHELTREGYDIRRKHLAGSVWVYHLERQAESGDVS